MTGGGVESTGPALGGAWGSSTGGGASSGGAASAGGSAGANGGAQSGGGQPAEPTPVECVEGASPPPLACEVSSCEVVFDTSITCHEAADVDAPADTIQNAEALALTADAAYLNVPVYLASQLLRITSEGAERDPAFPLPFAPNRLAANHAGELFAYGVGDGGKPLVRGVAGAWETQEGPNFLEETFLYAAPSGEPVLFGGTGSYTHAVHTSSGSADASGIMEPGFFVLDGEGAPISVGYQALYTGDDDLHAYRSSLLSLTRDELRGRVFPAPLPPLPAPEPIRPELGLVHSTPEGLAFGWLDGTSYTEALLEGTQTSLTECPGSGYGSCMPDCELVGTEIRQVVAVRDRRGNAYVAFAHTTVDRTVSGSFDQALYYCNYNPSRDDSVTELRVLRVDNGAAEARVVLTLPVPRLASLRLASFEDDFAIAFSSVGFRVARLHVENLP